MGNSAYKRSLAVSQWLGVGCLLATLAPSAHAKPKWHLDGVHTLNRCGPAALQVCAALLGQPIASEELEEYLPHRESLYSLAEIRDAAHSLGLSTLSVRWSSLYPRLPVSPAILPITFRGHPHFVVVTDSKLGQLCVADITHIDRGVWVSESHLRKKMEWDGTALHIGSGERFPMIYTWMYGSWVLAGAVLLVSVKAIRLRRTKKQTLPRGTSAVALLLVTTAGCTVKQDEIRFDRTPIVAEQVGDQPSGTLRCSLINDTPNDVTVRSLRASCPCVRIEAPSVASIPSGGKYELMLHVDYPAIGKREVSLLAECVPSLAGAGGSDVRYSADARLVVSANLRRVPRVEWATPLIDLVVDRPGVAEGLVEIQTIEPADSDAWISGLEIFNEDRLVTRINARVAELQMHKQPELCRRTYKFVIKLNRQRLRKVSGQMYARPEVSESASNVAAPTTIAVHIKCPFGVSPAAIVLQCRDGEPKDSSVTVAYEADLPYHVQRAELSCATGVVEVSQPVKDSHGLTQEVSWNVDWSSVESADGSSSDQLHKLVLYTNHPWYRAITIPVVVLSSQRATKIPATPHSKSNPIRLHADHKTYVAVAPNRAQNNATIQAIRTNAKDAQIFNKGVGSAMMISQDVSI